MSSDLLAQSRWWRLAKRAALIFGVIVLVFFISSVIILSLRKEKIVQELITYVNHQQAGEFELEYTDLSWFRHFPNVAVEVNNLRYFEHPKATRIYLEKPIIDARQVYFSINLWTLIRKSEIEVLNIDVQNASVRIEADSAGVLNIQRALKGQGKKGEQSVIINLKAIALDSIMMTWQSRHAQEPFALLIKEMDAQLDYAANRITAKLQSTQDLLGFKLFGRYLRNVGETNSDFDLAYDESYKVLTIHSGTVRYKELTVELAGFYDHLQDRMIEFSFESSSNDLVILKALIKEDIINMNKSLLQKSSIDMNGKVYGKLTEGNPQIDVSIHTRGLNVELPDHLGEFRNIGFEGSFRSGQPDDFSDAEIVIKNITGKIPGGSLAGSLRIRGFRKPAISYHVNASAKLDGYDRIFKFKNIKNLSGLISIQSDFEGQLDLANTNPPENPVNAIIQLDNIGFTLSNTNKKVSGVTGKVVLANREVSLQDVAFQLNSSRIELKGKLTNPYHLIFNHEHSIEAYLNLKSDRLFLRDVLDTIRTASINEKARVELEARLSSTASRIRADSGIPNFDFKIEKLAADFEQMPDLTQLTSSGTFSTDSIGMKLAIDDFYGQLPNSTISMKGIAVLNRKQELDLHTSLSVTQLPIQYVNTIIDEFHQNPKKRIQGDKTITTEFDLSASLVLNPFSVTRGEINGDVTLCMNNSCLEAADLSLRLENLNFKRSLANDSITGIKSINAKVTIPSFKLPGIGTTSFQAAIRSNETSGWLSLNNVTLDVRLPTGSVAMNGSVVVPSLDSVYTSAKLDLQKLSVLDVQILSTLFKLPDQPEKLASDKMKIISASLEASAAFRLNPFSIPKLEARSSKVELQFPDTVKLAGFSLGLNNVLFDDAIDSKTGISSFTGSVNMDEIELPVFGKSALNFDVHGQKDQVNVAITSNLVRAEKEQGAISFDFSKDPVGYDMSYTMEKIPMATAGKLLYDKEILSGPINLTMKMQGEGIDENALAAMKGTFYADGNNLVLQGIELDKFLKSYQKSQNFDLVDVGAFVLAGPAGPLVTKGSDFFKLLITDVKPTDETRIVQLVTQFNFDKGILSTEDVAFTTTENRIALKGQFDFAHKSIPGVTIAVVDKNGCSLLNQRFYGDIKKIEHDKLKVTSTLTGSVTNLANAVAARDCKIFYSGKVKHPE